MKAHISVLLILLCLFMSGCFIFRSPVIPPTGAVFSGYEAPVDITFNNTVIGSKQGTGSCTTILGLIAFGDASVAAAAREGNITRVDHVGYSFTNILCIYTNYEIIVYGE